MRPARFVPALAVKRCVQPSELVGVGRVHEPVLKAVPLDQMVAEFDPSCRRHHDDEHG
jgi:hypothetical protein